MSYGQARDGKITVHPNTGNAPQLEIFNAYTGDCALSNVPRYFKIGLNFIVEPMKTTI